MSQTLASLPFSNIAIDLYQAAHAFLAARLATVGIESELAASAILAVLGVTVAWGAFLFVLSIFFAGVSRLFGGAARADAPKPALQAGVMRQRAEPALKPKTPAEPGLAPRGGSLDIAPERFAAGARIAPRKPAPATAMRVEPSLARKEPAAPAAAQPEPKAPQGMSAVLEDLGFEDPAQATQLTFRKVALDHLPRLAPLGRAGFSRPEWTGATAPASMQDAGAFEVCRFKLRVPAGAETKAADSRPAAQTVDYRVCSLPRVSVTGGRRPDLLVYTTSERAPGVKSAAPLNRK